MQVITKRGMGRLFINRLTISIHATVFGEMVAFYFAWLRFAKRKTLFPLVISLMVVRLQVKFIPILHVCRWLGLSGTFPGIWLAHTGYGLPLTTYLIYAFIFGLPWESMDSALIEG